VGPQGDRGPAGTDDAYDYHLIYNSDDDLTGFTTNSGSITCTFINDSFDELIKINVVSGTDNYFIVLVWENYDPRSSSSETDDKGKLTDVVMVG
jgi:hypothetical protein